MSFKMDPEVKRLWLDALASDEFEPLPGLLKPHDDPAVDAELIALMPKTRCCVGVLEELALRHGVIEKFKRTLSSAFPSDATRTWAGESRVYTGDMPWPTLANINDDECTNAERDKRKPTFAPVILYIERNL